MSPVPKRRWFAYRLRTLFVVVTMFGCWLGYELQWIRQRHEFLADEWSTRQRLPADGVKVSVTYSNVIGSPAPRAPWMLWAFGEDGYSTVFILADSKNVKHLTDRDRERVRRARQLFSEAIVKTVHVEWTAHSSYAESAIPPDR